METLQPTYESNYILTGDGSFIGEEENCLFTFKRGYYF